MLLMLHKIITQSFQPLLKYKKKIKNPVFTWRPSPCNDKWGTFLLLFLSIIFLGMVTAICSFMYAFY